MVDYESIQPDHLSSPTTGNIKWMIFVGAHQNRLPFELVSSIQFLGDRAEYVKIASIGPNALDFHIAFHIGRIAALDPSAYFHIISKDKGFDPLRAHLKERKIFSARWETMDEMPVFKAATDSATDRVARVVEKLAQQNGSKPKSVKTLSSSINALFQKQLPECDVQAIVEALQKSATISITDNKVTYPWDNGGSHKTYHPS